MQKQVILTDEGLRNYEEELEFLKTVKRKEITEQLTPFLNFSRQQWAELRKSVPLKLTEQDLKPGGGGILMQNVLRYLECIMT